MRVVNQDYKILFRSPPELIERVGRVAYKSEDRIGKDTWRNFLRMIVGRGHGAVLEHSMMTVLFTTDRGISHEIVRHRVASFTQESTRYCNYTNGKFDGHLTFIRPEFCSHRVVGEFDDFSTENFTDEEFEWLMSTKKGEEHYQYLIERGLAPQHARTVLPNCLKTEIAVTANYREWSHIFQLRAVEKAAHPQMRALMLPLYQELRSSLPEIFDLGDPE